MVIIRHLSSRSNSSYPDITQTPLAFHFIPDTFSRVHSETLMAALTLVTLQKQIISKDSKRLENIIALFFYFLMITPTSQPYPS